MVKLLQNLYWEQRLNELIDVEVSKLSLKSKSQFVRLILKKNFGCCVVEGCYNPAYVYGCCFVHFKKNKKNSFFPTAGEKGDINATQ